MKPSELLEQREQEVKDLGNVYADYYHDELGTMVILKAKHTKNGRKRDEHLASGESRRKTVPVKLDGKLIGWEQDEDDEVMGEAIALGRALKMYHKLYPEPQKVLTVSTGGLTWTSQNLLTLR